MSFVMSGIGNMISSLLGLGGGGGPSSSDQASADAAAKAQAEKDAIKQSQSEAAARAQSLRRSAPDAQAQVGGSLTDAPFASLTSYISGAPSSLQEALRALGLDKDQSGGGGGGGLGLAFTGGS